MSLQNIANNLDLIETRNTLNPHFDRQNVKTRPHARLAKQPEARKL